MFPLQWPRQRQKSGTRSVDCQVPLSSLPSETVETPILMGFNDFQKWRKHPDGGKRPSTLTDGFQPSAKIEAELWRSVMLQLFGEEWNLQLAVQDASRSDVA